MKRAFYFVVPFVLAFVLSAARADDTEVSGTVGCAHCNFSKETGATSCGGALKVGDKVYTLTGKNVDHSFKKGGDWTVKGEISKDGKSIEVKEMKKKA